MNKNILYFTRTMGLGGTENVVLQLCEIMNKNRKIVVCSCGGVNVEQLSNMGIKHYLIPDIENKNPKVAIMTLKILLKIIRDENIEIIHTHHRMAAFYVRIIGFIKKIISINTAHNTFKDKKLLTKFAYKNTNLIAVGKEVKRNLCEFYGLPSEQVTIIYNGIKPFDKEIQTIDLIDEFRKKGYYIVGNVGRLSEQKGFKYFIEAASIVLKENSMVKFLIIGEGEERVKLEEIVRKLNLDESIIFMGYRNDVQNIISQLDLVVLTSLWEGLPLTPLEAFSVEKTIIATAVDGTIEIVDDEINGFLVEPKNSNIVAEKITNLLKDEEKRKQFGKNAKEKYKSEFSFDAFSEKYKKYYYEIKEI